MENIALSGNINQIFQAARLPLTPPTGDEVNGVLKNSIRFFIL